MGKVINNRETTKEEQSGGHSFKSGSEEEMETSSVEYSIRDSIIVTNDKTTGQNGRHSRKKGRGCVHISTREKGVCDCDHIIL